MTGHRKSIMFLACLGTSALLLWFGKLVGAEWVSFMSIAFPFFIAGNAAEHFANGKKAAA